MEALDEHFWEGGETMEEYTMEEIQEAIDEYLQDGAEQSEQG